MKKVNMMNIKNEWLKHLIKLEILLKIREPKNKKLFDRTRRNKIK